MPEPPSGPPSRFSLLFVVLRGGFAGFVAAAVLELLYIFVGTNVHVVAPGYVYRAVRWTARTSSRSPASTGFAPSST